jgi:CheY-like chemotaxis protein
MIRVLIVDDPPAVRAGLVAVMRAEPGLLPVASAADPDGALAEARQRHPHVALVDYHLREGDGLLVCRDQAMTAGAARLDTRDLPILGMLMERTPPAEIAKVLRLDERELDSRVEAMLTRLRIRTDHDPERA